MRREKEKSSLTFALFELLSKDLLQSGQLSVVHVNEQRARGQLERDQVRSFLSISLLPLVFFLSLPRRLHLYLCLCGCLYVWSPSPSASLALCVCHTVSVSLSGRLSISLSLFRPVT
jgi:hypothetical protein